MTPHTRRIWMYKDFPPEKKVVLVWLKNVYLPFCGYMKYAAGDKNCPYWIVYHGNKDRSTEVVAWCDCLPNKGPENIDCKLYESGQIERKTRRKG